MTLYIRRNGRRYGQVPPQAPGGESTIQKEDATDILLEDGTPLLTEVQ